MPNLISFEHLLKGDIRSYKFQGHEAAGDSNEIDFSFFVINYLQPGLGPGLHRHPYAEVFVTLSGEALFTVGEEEFTLHAGQIAIAPPNTPHKFVSTGDVPLRQVDIHGSGTMVQEELE
jgi:mannose-6-phosphate isomerase-like protein (cupin superfamily)